MDRAAEELASSLVNVISGFSGTNMTLPKLPREITKDLKSTYCSLFLHDGNLMVFGSTDKKPSKCFQLENLTWKEHSTLNRKRVNSATVTTDKGTFVFGGVHNGKSYEYLPIGSKKWKIGKSSLLQLHDRF